MIWFILWWLIGAISTGLIFRKMSKKDIFYAIIIFAWTGLLMPIAFLLGSLCGINSEQEEQ